MSRIELRNAKRRVKRQFKCEIQMLEQRLFFAVTPAEPRANTLGAIFDKNERQDLLARLTHLDATTRADLQSRLNTSLGKFDTGLLNYMRSRTGPKFFFDPSKVAELGDFITDNSIDTTEVITHADAITDHKFPEQGNVGEYTIQLPANVNWVAPGGSTNPEFLHNLNRFEYQRELVSAAAITGDAKYAAEFEYQLASWSQQFTTAKVPAAWSASDKEAWELDSALRGESWSWAYNGFLHNANFTGAENSLFLYKLAQTADYLYGAAAATTSFGSNKTIVTGKALLFLGTLFPEFDESNLWKDQAHTVLFKCMDTQIYPDGSHVEQSPGYIFNVSNDLLDARMIDRVNGVAWPKEQRIRLANMVDAYWQFLSPNGRRPAIGDSYRNQSIRLFNKPNIILETTRWPMVKPGVGDVFIGGIAAVTPFLSAPTTPDTLGARGKTFAMENSGNYVMRSGDDKQAVQINFDAGPKGGSHGHLDLLNFELSGGGRALISDPGAYKYIPSDPSRKYVISTAAHNTLNVDGLNHAALEGSTNPDIIVSQFEAGTDHAQITAAHRAYKAVAGSPLLTRSMWYDLDGTIVIVDWAQSSVSHNFQQSFNLQTEGDANNNFTFDLANRTARTQYPSGGNVQIEGVTTSAADAQLSFVTNTASGDYKDDAYRFTLTQTGKFVVMVTLINAYNGTTPPDVTASLTNTPTENGPVYVLLTKGGVSKQLEFARPATIAALDSKATSRGTFNDIAFDSANRLHLVYADRDANALMYAVRETNGAWSVPQIIDSQANSDALGAYQYVSVAVGPTGLPAVAYFDGWNGDLKFASRSAGGSWTAITADSKGSTGLYPSLAFSRAGTATISYYNRTTKDLMLASGVKGGFSLSAIDTTGDVGRFSSLALEPNSPTTTVWAVGYEDTTNGDYKYAIQNGAQGAFTTHLVDNLPLGGGYTSLAFYGVGPKATRKFHPALSYYDASDTGLRFAKSTDFGQTWSAQTVVTTKVQGLYTSLFFDPLGQPNIYFFDRTNNEARRAILTGTTWNFTDLRAGGREIHTSLNSLGNVAYSSLNEATGLLNVFVI